MFLKSKISTEETCNEENKTEIVGASSDWGAWESLSKEWNLKLTWILKGNQSWEDLGRYLSRPENGNCKHS